MLRLDFVPTSNYLKVWKLVEGHLFADKWKKANAFNAQCIKKSLAEEKLRYFLKKKKSISQISCGQFGGNIWLKA